MRLISSGPPTAMMPSASWPASGSRLDRCCRRRACRRWTATSSGSAGRCARRPLRAAATRRASRARGPPARRRRAPRPGPAPRQGRRHRAQLPRPRRRGGRRGAAGPARLRQVAELGHRPRRRDPLGPGAHRPGRLRGRARGRDRPSGASRLRGRRPRPRVRLHLPQRRLGARPPVRRRPVGPRQVARHVLPDGAGARDRRRDPRPAGPRHPLPRQRRRSSRRPTPSQMFFGVAEIISYCSQAFTLEPGDVIATGTPGGVGIFRDPPILLADGDEVVVEIEGIGRLVNTCRFAPAAVAVGMTGPTERFLVTGALGCIGAWTVRALAREGAPVAAFDLGRDARRLRLIMTPDELAGVTFVVGDITDSPVSSGRSTTRGSPTSSISPRSRCRSAGPTRRAAPSSTSSGRSTSSRRSSAAAERMAPIVYTSSIGMLRGRGRRPGDRPARATTPPRTRRTTTASTSWRTRAPPGSTGSMTASSVGLRPMTVYGVGRDQGMTSGPTKAIVAAVLGQPVPRSRSVAPRSSSTPRTSPGPSSRRAAARSTAPTSSTCRARGRRAGLGRRHRRGGPRGTRPHRVRSGRAAVPLRDRPRRDRGARPAPGHAARGRHRRERGDLPQARR